MANVVACVDGCRAVPNGAEISLSVSNDVNEELVFSTSFRVNFASSTNQKVADIKQRVADLMTGFGMPTVVGDVTLFGGPV